MTILKAVKTDMDRLRSIFAMVDAKPPAKPPVGAGQVPTATAVVSQLEGERAPGLDLGEVRVKS